MSKPGVDDHHSSQQKPQEAILGGGANHIFRQTKAGTLKASDVGSVPGIPYKAVDEALDH